MKHLFLILIIFINFTQAAEAKKIILQLSWLHQFQFAGYYVAKELGFYKELGIDLEIKEYKYGLDLSNAIENNKADFVIGRSSLLIDKFEGKDIVIIAAIFQNSPLMLLVKKDSGIKKIEDLKNKNIMMTSDAKSSASIVSMLSSKGVRIEDVNIQKHSFNLDDLINNKTDAMASYISNEPLILDEKKIPYNIFHPKDYGFNFYDDILYTSRNFIKKNPELTKKFYEASIRGWEYAFENKTKTASIINEKYNTQNKTEFQLVKEAEILKKLVFDKNDGEIGAINEDRLKNIVHTYKILGLMNENMNFDELIYEYNHHKTYNFNFTKTDIIFISIILILFIIVIVSTIVITSVRKKWLLTKNHLNDEIKIKTKILTQERDFLSIVFERIPYYALVYKNDKIERVNKLALDFFGFANKEEMIKKSVCIADYFVNEKTYISRIIEEEHWLKYISKHPDKYHALVKKNKRRYILDIEVIDFNFSEKNQFLVILKDITKESLKYKQMKYKIEYDPILRIYNRSKFNEILAFEIKRQKRTTSSMVLMIIDIDHFKKVNDTYGHLIGDVVLLALSLFIKKNKRETDIFARWGGEEFVLLLLETDIEKGFNYAEKLRKMIENKHIPQVGSIKCSFGITQYKNNDSKESLFKRCDDALYEAKENGRNQVRMKI